LLARFSPRTELQLEWEFGQRYPNNTAYEAVRISRLQVGPPDEEGESQTLTLARANIWMKYHRAETQHVLDEEALLLAAEFAAKHKEEPAQHAVDILTTVAESGFVSLS